MHDATPMAGFAVLILATAVALRLGTASVVLAVDGTERVVRTHAPTVGDLLVEQAVAVGADDLVSPGPDERLEGDALVVIHRARPVDVVVDGRTLRLRSHGRSAEDVLAQARVTVGPSDRIIVNGAAWPVRRDREHQSLPIARLASASLQSAPNPGGGPSGDGPPPGGAASWTIQVFRAVPVELLEDGLPFRVELAGPTLGDGLASAGIPLHDADGINPDRETPLTAGMRVSLRRATAFTVHADGEVHEARALAATVGEALTATGMGLVGRDYSVPAADATLEVGMSVQLIRVVEDVLVQEMAIPFRTETVPDPGMELDSTRVEVAGVPGQKTQRIRIVYENGEEKSRDVIEETVERDPVNQVVAYGTNVVWHTVNTPDGPMRYWRKMRVYATSYSASRAGTPKSAPWYGRTRLGWQMRKGIVAVDPNVIAMQSAMYVEGYGVGVAGDTGGGLRRYHIDLGYDDDNYVSWHQYVDLYLIEPIPPDRDMIWILP